MANNALKAKTTTLEKLHSSEQREQQVSNENVGFGSGLVIGAIIAGPIGAIISGIGGAMIAKHSNTVDDVETLSVALEQEQQDHQQVITAYNQKLQKAEQGYQNELLALEQSHQSRQQIKAENLLMSLQFSTGSSDIAPHYQEQVAALADVLNQSPTLSIDLSGYTDLSGDESLNQTLSQARVESVKTLLMAQGVKENQITTFAFGENSPVVANSEKQVSFYDRRVVLKLHAAASQTAKN